jgi:hypothetical protein
MVEKQRIKPDTVKNPKYHQLLGCLISTYEENTMLQALSEQLTVELPQV